MPPFYVIGHKNPDTDAICSAIGYAALLRAVGEEEDPDQIISLQTTFLGIVRMHEHLRTRYRTVQLRHTSCHGAGMPVFDDTTSG